MKSISDTVEDLLEPFLRTKGLELYDLAFVKEGPHRYLRVFIDSEKGISLKDCEEVSKYLSESLDETDPIKEQYFLEVSSPGMERLLKKDEHYEKYINHAVQLNLFTNFQGNKIIKGKLLSKNSEHVIVQEDTTGKELEIPVALIAKAKNIVEF